MQNLPDLLLGARDRAQDLWFEVTGPRGWRSIAGPAAFATGSIALLLYDHLHQRVPASLFWLTLTLIVVVFAWMLETNRRQVEALAAREHDSRSDSVTGLDNRLCLETDMRDAIAAGDRRVLLLFDLDGLQTYTDRFGYGAGNELVRRVAQTMIESANPFGGKAYRVDDTRLALLVPAGDYRIGEIVLSATSSLQDEGRDLLIGRAYGELVLPDEAADPEIAMQIAGQRLASHNQSQHRSARRQAHAVLMSVLAARRPELRNHLRVVAFRAISLGRRLGLDREDLDDVALAAELQDVGLLAVPESVLEKEGRLSQEEMELIRNRPVAGERIIGAAPGLSTVAALVRSSAERFDGSGFPDGLAGDAIPLGSRIVAVAVAYAAMTASRPYRAASSPEDALAELRRCAGSQFDPDVVEALAADISEELGAPAAPAVVA